MDPTPIRAIRSKEEILDRDERQIAISSQNPRKSKISAKKNSIYRYGCAIHAN